MFLFRNFHLLKNPKKKSQIVFNIDQIEQQISIL